MNLDIIIQNAPNFDSADMICVTLVTVCDPALQIAKQRSYYEIMNKMALITVSTRGIGFAIVKAFAKEEAIVYMAARNMESAEEQAKLLSSQGLSVRCVYNNAERTETFHSMIEEVISKEEELDVLVNNFGTSDIKVDLDFMYTDWDVFLNIVNQNLGSVFLASQAVSKYMAKNGGGSIINISSVGGEVPDRLRHRQGGN